jgi:NarL family two-component system response regulator LiaR
MIRVIICDDQDVVCEGLQTILKTAGDIEVVGVAHDGAEGLDAVARLKPDVVLMDLKMPGMNGIHATRLIRERFPEVSVLVLTTYDADEWVFDAIRSGAAGYLLKDVPRLQLIEAIRGTAAGKTHVDPAVAGKLFDHVVQNTSSLPDTTLSEELSERDLEILHFISLGLSNAGIAQNLNLSEGTVRNYISTLFQKLNVTDRTQAAIYAMRYGLLQGGKSSKG